MISFKYFQKIVIEKLNRDISFESNENQNIAISSDANDSLFIVAGPGSGKTTVMVLKILKFIFVDDIKPNEILATTFTRKSANELKSRLLSWGDLIKREIINDMFNNLTGDFTDLNVHGLDRKITSIDFNKITIGTLDSIIEEVLRLNRKPGTQAPVVVEEFISKSIMIQLLLKENKENQEAIQKYIGKVNNKKETLSLTLICQILIELKDRLYYDQVNFNDLLKIKQAELHNKKNKHAEILMKMREIEISIGGDDLLTSDKESFKRKKGTKLEIENEINILEGMIISFEIIKNYISILKKENLCDFTMLESEFLSELENGRLDKFKNSLKLVLVDEYQDTNLLQEKIYFELSKSTITRGGSLTIVGDDDQSLYRFRGATVDLFTEFQKRVKIKVGISVKMIYLSKNYRSTKKIVDFCNDFIKKDEKFQEVRVSDKEDIIPFKTDDSNDIPIIGMFRDNEKLLAKDLSRFIKSLVSGKELKIKSKNYKNNSFENESLDFKQRPKIKLNEKNGSASDIAILTYSPKEVNSKNRQLPLFLRKYLSENPSPIDVYNPRGVNIEENEYIQVLCGLLLKCIDFDLKYQKAIKDLPKLADRNFKLWRKKANEFIEKKECYIAEGISLKDFIKAWAERTPIGHDIWPQEASIMELTYKLITVIEKLQNDMEGLVYLQAITKTISQTGFFNKYNANIFYDKDKILEKESIIESYWNIFIPIAIGSINIDENLLDTIPEKMINIMSIHQSKGLEFPIVIVDVGSRFKNPNPVMSFARFPNTGGKSCFLENELRTFSELGNPSRNSIDRAFDDLIRLYYVAFSRAQEVLIIIGLNSSIEGYKVKNNIVQIPNIALGWTRDKEYKPFKDVYLI